MTIKIKHYFNLRYIFVFILIMLAITSFIWPFINQNNRKLVENNNLNISLADVAGYLRFLFNSNKTSTTFDIALHNFSLALIAYILSTISAGILSIISFCSAFYIAGSVLKISCDIYTISFVILELIGMNIATFNGISLYYKRTKKNTSLKKIIQEMLIVILILASIYFFAAFIESNLISKIWSLN